MLVVRENWQSRPDNRRRSMERGSLYERKRLGEEKVDDDERVGGGLGRGFKSGREADLDHCEFQHERWPMHMAPVPIGWNKGQTGKEGGWAVFTLNAEGDRWSDACHSPATFVDQRRSTWRRHPRPSPPIDVRCPGNPRLACGWGPHTLHQARSIFTTRCPVFKVPSA